MKGAYKIGNSKLVSGADRLCFIRDIILYLQQGSLLKKKCYILMFGRLRQAIHNVWNLSTANRLNLTKSNYVQ